MSKLAKLLSCAVIAALAAPPAVAASLSAKENARVARAAPRDRDDLRWCLLQRKKGAKKGTIIGGAGGAGVSLLAGGGVGETVLAAGAGALVGNRVGHGANSKACDRVLKRNP